MKTLGIIAFLYLFSFASSALENKSFGTGANMDKLVAISTLLSSPNNYLDQEVTVAGTIVSVCSKRGC